jgi:hypothetical protein
MHRLSSASRRRHSFPGSHSPWSCCRHITDSISSGVIAFKLHAAQSCLALPLTYPRLDSVATASAVLARLGLECSSIPSSPPLLSSDITPIYSGTHPCCSAFSLPPLSSPAPPNAQRPRPSHRRQLPLTPSGHNSTPAFRTPGPRIPHLFLFSALTLQVLPVLLRSCAPLLTLLLRHADTHALACPLDLAPLAPYASHLPLPYRSWS